MGRDGGAGGLGRLVPLVLPLGSGLSPFSPCVWDSWRQGGWEVRIGATREEQSGPSQAASPGEHWLNGKVKVLKWGRWGLRGCHQGPCAVWELV